MRNGSAKQRGGLFGQLVPDGKGGSGRTAVHTQLVEDMHQVTIHGTFANDQRVSDFLVACASRDENRMPSSSSFRTSLLAYHLLPFSPNVWHDVNKLDRFFLRIANSWRKAGYLILRYVVSSHCILRAPLRYDLMR